MQPKNNNSVYLVPMTGPEYNDYVLESAAGYAADKVASGEWTEDESLALAQEEIDKLLPRGHATPDNYLFTLRAAPGSAALGVLWYAVRKRAGKQTAYIYDIVIRPEHQRRGYASAALQALEEEVARRGLAGIGLHVFGHNRAARDLYEKMGFTPSNIILYKALDSGLEK